MHSAFGDDGVPPVGSFEKFVNRFGQLVSPERQAAIYRNVLASWREDNGDAETVYTPDGWPIHRHEFCMFFVLMDKPMRFR